jgi:hypothetical protein
MPIAIERDFIVISGHESCLCVFGEEGWGGIGWDMEQ